MITIYHIAHTVCRCTHHLFRNHIINNHFKRLKTSVKANKTETLHGFVVAAATAAAVAENN